MPNVVDITITADDRASGVMDKVKGDFDKSLSGMRGLAMVGGAAIGSAFAGPIVAAAGAAAAALASAGAAVGAFALAVKPQFSAISDVVKAYDKQQESTASGSEGMARRIADAQRQVSAAVRDAGFKHREALERVEDAEDSLAEAQRDAKRAQDDLNDARKEAKEDAEELAQRINDAQFDMRDGALAVAEAQQRLNEVLADPEATDLQKQRAQLALETAQRSYAEQQKGLADLQDKQREADRVGIEGSEKVKDAKDKVRDSNTKVKDSEEDLAHARENVARVDKAASDAIAAARSALAAASQQAGAATESFEDKLAKLPPATQETARAFIALREETKAWSDSLAPKTMPAMTEGINILRDIIPMLTPLVEAASDAFKEFLEQLHSDVNSGGLKDFIEALADSARKTLPDFLNSIKNIAVGIGGIIAAFLPFSGTVTGGIEGATAAFAEWGKGLKDSEGFKSFIGGVREALPIIGEFLQRLLSAGAEIAKGLAPISGIGLGLVKMFGELLQAIPAETLQNLAPIIMAVVGAVKAWQLAQGLLNVVMMANPVMLIVAAIAGLIAVLVIAYKKSEDFRNAVNEAWTSIRDAVAPIIEEIWGKIRDDLIPAFMELMKALEPVATWFVEKLAPYAKTAFEALFQIIRGAVDIITGIIKVFTGILTGDWSKVWEGIQQIVRGAMDIVMGILKQAWNSIYTVFKVGIELIGKIFEGLGKLLVDAFGSMGTSMANSIKVAWAYLYNALVWLKDKFMGFFSNIGDWLGNAGEWLVYGLINGIRRVAGWVHDAIAAIVPDFLESYIPGFASGGIIGAAGGGPRSNLVMVGEQGRELVRLPFGSTVIPNGQTESMMSASQGGGGVTRLVIDSAGSRFDDLLIEVLRTTIRDRGGIDLVFGRS